jgi:hypothetical protein
MGLVVVLAIFRREKGVAGAPLLAVTRRKSRVAGKRCRTCGPFPMHINTEHGEKI